MEILRLNSYGQRGVKGEYLLKEVFKTFRFPGLVVFSDNTKHHLGRTLVTAIRKNKLGKVVSSAKAPNPNMGGQTVIQAWVWAPDRAAFAEWGKARGLSNRMHKKDYGRFGTNGGSW
jgi:hypothetical protein